MKDKIINLTETEAVKILKDGGWNFRIVKKDGVGRVITKDYIPERLNLTIENNIVTNVGFG